MINQTIEKGATVRVKGIARFIVEGSPIGSIFKARSLSLKVQSVTGESDIQLFYENYKTRSLYSKGTTQVEYAMKQLELDGVVRRVAPRTWEKIK